MGVEPTRRLDVKGILPDLPDRRNARQRQEKTEVIMKIGVVAGDGLAITEVLRLKTFAVGGEDELDLVPSSSWAIPQACEGSSHLTFRANLQMDIIALEYAAGQVRLVRATAFKPLDRGWLVTKGFEESKGELLRVKGSFSQSGNGFFDFDCIHTPTINSSRISIIAS